MSTKAKVAFVASLVVTVGGLAVLAGTDTQSTEQLVVIVGVLVAEFAVAATAYFGLEEMNWFSRRRKASWLGRGLAFVALLVSVAAILLVSLFTYVTAGVVLD